MIFYSFESEFSNIIGEVYRSHFDSSINEIKYEINRMVEIEIVDGEIINKLYFVDPVNFDNTIVKNIKIKVFNEYLFPLSLLIPLFIAFEFSLKRTLIATVLLVLVLYFKGFVIVYDNYSFPDHILKDLTIMYYPVYFSNALINEIGSAINLLIVIYIWFSFNSKTIIEKFSSFQENPKKLRKS